MGRALGTRPLALTVPAPVLRVAGLVASAVAAGTARPSIFNYDKVKEALHPQWVCDDSLARTELGFRPSMPLDLGIHDTVRWWREQDWL
jgi:nucleoside-diphosphate-sugar epimerase